MKSVLRFGVVMLIGLLVLGACQKKEAAPEATVEVAEEPAGISIGVSKIVSHPALDAIEKGIQDELAELGFEDVTYDFQNANGDPNTAKQIAVKFKADNVDIAVVDCDSDQPGAGLDDYRFSGSLLRGNRPGGGGACAVPRRTGGQILPATPT